MNLKPLSKTIARVWKFIQMAASDTLEGKVLENIESIKYHVVSPGFALGFFSLSPPLSTIFIFCVPISVNLGHFLPLFASHINPMIKFSTISAQES